MRRAAKYALVGAGAVGLTWALLSLAAFNALVNTVGALLG